MNDSIKLEEYDRSCLEAYGILNYLIFLEKLEVECEFDEVTLRDQYPDALPLICSNQYLRDNINGNFYTEQIILLLQEGLMSIFEQDED